MIALETGVGSTCPSGIDMAAALVSPASYTPRVMLVEMTDWGKSRGRGSGLDLILIILNELGGNWFGPTDLGRLFSLPFCSGSLERGIGAGRSRSDRHGRGASCSRRFGCTLGSQVGGGRGFRVGCTIG